MKKIFFLLLIPSSCYSQVELGLNQGNTSRFDASDLIFNSVKMGTGVEYKQNEYVYPFCFLEYCFNGIYGGFSCGDAIVKPSYLKGVMYSAQLGYSLKMKGKFYANAEIAYRQTYYYSDKWNYTFGDFPQNKQYLILSVGVHYKFKKI